MTHALLFSVDKYNRYDLDRLDGKQLIELAEKEQEGAYWDGGKTDILSLEVFQEDLNGQHINMESWWVYFVEQ